MRVLWCYSHVATYIVLERPVHIKGGSCVVDNCPLDYLSHVKHIAAATRTLQCLILGACAESFPLGGYVTNPRLHYVESACTSSHAMNSHFSYMDLPSASCAF